MLKTPASLLLFRTQRPLHHTDASEIFRHGCWHQPSAAAHSYVGKRNDRHGVRVCDICVSKHDCFAKTGAEPEQNKKTIVFANEKLGWFSRTQARPFWRLSGTCPACTKRLLSQLFLCSPRACLGKMIIFSIKSLEEGVFRTQPHPLPSANASIEPPRAPLKCVSPHDMFRFHAAPVFSTIVAAAAAVRL